MTLRSTRLSAIILTVSLFISLGNTSITSSQQSTIEINLYEGMNLISLPCTPENSSIDVVLADILDYVETVLAFDGETKIWSSYSPGIPGNLNEMVEDKGYIICVNKDVVLTIHPAGYILRNPSMQEVYDFLADDKTDENNFSDEYYCRHFACDFKKNALEEGYICYYVSLNFQEGSHALVAFNTTDMGMVYIETQTDDIMEPQIGDAYYDLTKFKAPDFNDTIIDIFLIP